MTVNQKYCCNSNSYVCNTHTGWTDTSKPWFSANLQYNIGQGTTIMSVSSNFFFQCKVEEYKICEKLTQTWRARTICLARSRGVRGHSGAAFGRSLHLFAHSSALCERYMHGAKQRYALAHSGYARTKLSCVQSNIFVRTQLCFVPRKWQLRSSLRECTRSNFLLGYVIKSIKIWDGRKPFQDQQK